MKGRQQKLVLLTTPFGTPEEVKAIREQVPVTIRTTMAGLQRMMEIKEKKRTRGGNSCEN